jgi:uncharacterized protein (DUF302 family)
MPNEGSLRYSLPESFERTVELICDALLDHGMSVVGQMDVTKRLGRSLGIALEPCRVLFVLPQPKSLRADTIHPWGAAFLPLHVVISGGACGCDVHIENTMRAVEDAGAPGVYAPVVEIQRRVSKAIEAVAARSSILA